MNVGSLCTGYAGLDLAVHAVLGGDMAWYSEIEPAACRLLETRFPNVPNLSDLTAVDWTAVEPVDVLTAGYPCQPFSHAGRRQGANDERHLWPHIADCVRVLRPRLVVLENVAGHLSLGLDTVTSDLAALGYVGRYGVVRASDVGACHQRARVFIVASDTEDERRERSGTPWRRWSRLADCRVAATDADRDGRRRIAELNGEPPAGLNRSSRRHAHGRGVEDAPAGPGSCGPLVADTDGSGLEGREPARGHVVRSWGRYESAIRRHERAVGRRAPDPVDDAGRLSSQFVEWMMMLPAGWVTDVLESRAAALKMLGNGVVPPQAVHALRELLSIGAEQAA